MNKRKYIIYDGKKWCIKKNGYYYTSKTTNYKRVCTYLHRYIWEQNNGKIPYGYHIHHIDLNHSNNDISNLTIMTISDHHSLHGKLRSPEAIEKTRLSRLGKKHSPETIEKMRLVKLGKKHSPETIEKMRVSHLRENLSPETIEKIRMGRLGKKNSPETNEKNRKSHLGKKRSDYAKQRMREGWAERKRILSGG